jgi:NADP-dependent 3-hydroxy acid dehydrogenase YdfG
MSQSSGRAVVVTGASSGIGAAIACALGAAGYELWLTGRSAEGLKSTAVAVQEAGGVEPHCKALDLTEAGALAGVIRQVGEAHPHLFGLVNNAGVMHPESILAGKPERWRSMFNLNVLAPLEGCRAAVELMRRQGGPGHLINVSSVAAQWDDGGVYAASKRALEIVSSTLRLELEHDNIRVTTLVPGGFATRLGRHLEPDTLERIGASMKAKGFEPGQPVNERMLGDPAHLARAVVYILEQPASINVERIVIRPPVNTTYY